MRRLRKQYTRNRTAFARTILGVEHLERREMFAYTSSISSGIATMVGDAVSDVLLISQSGNFLSHNRAASEGFASNLDFVSGDGSVVTTLVAATPTSLHVFAGAGDDTVSLANGLTFLKAEINGGDGVDTLDYSRFTTPTFTSTGGEDLLLGQLGPSSAAAAAGRVVGGISGIMFNPDNNTFTIGIEVRGIALNNLIGANLRRGPAGSGGPVIFAFGNSDNWAESQGVVTRTLVDAVLPSSFAADFLAGNTYLNIETRAFPAGEIQGQVLPSALPHTATGLADGGLKSIENVIGGSATNGMIGGDESNHFVGGPAFDMLLGRAGNDVLEGLGAFDVLVGGVGSDQILGGDGDDRVVWNNGDGSDSVDGGSGSDVVVINGSALDGDTFEFSVNGNRHRVQRTNLNPITVDIANAEQVTFNTQGGNDSVLVRETMPGFVVAVNGGIGDDFVVVDSNGFLPGGEVSGLKGALIVDGGIGNNSLYLEDQSDSTGDVVTVTPTAIGAAPGDNFFGIGGRVQYQRIQNVTLNMPSALTGDTIHVYPSAQTAFVINGNNPTNSKSSQQDTLILHLDDEIERAKFKGKGTGAGQWTFANALSVSFTGIEKRKILDE